MIFFEKTKIEFAILQILFTQSLFLKINSFHITRFFIHLQTTKNEIVAYDF